MVDELKAAVSVSFSLAHLDAASSAVAADAPLENSALASQPAAHHIVVSLPAGYEGEFPYNTQLRVAVDPACPDQPFTAANYLFRMEEDGSVTAIETFTVSLARGIIFDPNDRNGHVTRFDQAPITIGAGDKLIYLNLDGRAESQAA